MDPIFDRLGRLIRSNNPFRSGSPASDMSPDEQAAFDELEAELNGTKREAPKASAQGGRSYSEQGRSQAAQPSGPAPDPALVKAYTELGLAYGASWEEVGAAHRSLLKKHHPDRHAGNEALVKAATLKSQKINEAFQVLKKHLGR